ncbi:Heptahelical transmembrane protein 3 [Camellia lanceoleosa]|uniref:Heptahelical transmembrane protein 3 n=1 Tax=Camellia lanceoleosa TaxID=1840588 RepID=A0ACC0G9R0_9ERIC|nr:Heptahelical transmembrane protein 3 [Camellia lanceoleosa]
MKRRGRNSAKLGGNGEEERASQVDSGQNMKQGFERRLVKYESLPEYLKDNEFILDYYRCKWPLKETLFSVFTWHNETLNIWTHSGGFIIFVALTVLSSLEKTNIESMIISFFRPTIQTPWTMMMMVMTTKTDANSSDSFFPTSNLGELIPPGIIPTLSDFWGNGLFNLQLPLPHRWNVFFWRLDYASISLMIVCSFFAPIYHAFSCNPYS